MLMDTQMEGITVDISNILPMRMVPVPISLSTPLTHMAPDPISLRVAAWAIPSLPSASSAPIVAVDKAVN